MKTIKWIISIIIATMVTVLLLYLVEYAPPIDFRGFMEIINVVLNCVLYGLIFIIALAFCVLFLGLTE